MSVARLIFRPVPLIIFLIFLDAIALGITVPVLPLLLRSMTPNWALLFGALSSGYAVFQMAAAPTLARLSDRLGPKPVLVAAAAAVSVDSLVCATTSSLAVLVVARLVAGAFAANAAIWNVCIGQEAHGDERAQLFSYRSAAFCFGAIIGTALGSVLSQVSLRIPFFAGASITLVIVAFLICFGSDIGRGALCTGEYSKCIPRKGARRVTGLLLAVHFTVQVVSQIGMVIWTINGQERYDWDPFTNGMSLCLYGLLSGVVQVILTPPLVRHLGQWRPIFLFLAIDAIAHAFVAFATQGWMFFALLPLLALPGVAPPMLQSLLSSYEDSDRQGALQARVTQLTASAAIVTPLAATAIHAATQTTMPGLIWLVAAAVYIPAAPFFFVAWKRAKTFVLQPNS